MHNKHRTLERMQKMKGNSATGPCTRFSCLGMLAAHANEGNQALELGNGLANLHRVKLVTAGRWATRQKRDHLLRAVPVL